jgi:hypothetical protein
VKLFFSLKLKQMASCSWLTYSRVKTFTHTLLLKQCSFKSFSELLEKKIDSLTKGQSKETSLVKNFNGQNVERKNAELDKTLTGKNSDWDKRSKIKNVDWHKMLKSKKRRLEKM